MKGARQRTYRGEIQLSQLDLVAEVYDNVRLIPLPTAGIGRW